VQVLSDRIELLFAGAFLKRWCLRWHKDLPANCRDVFGQRERCNIILDVRLGLEKRGMGA
jgi:hypothetical protein